MPRIKKRNKKITYEFAPDLQFKAEDISRILFPHIKISNIKCLRSFNSTSRGTIARCHTLGKVMQLTIGTSAWYGIEFISERFDKMSKEDQIKTIIHELMHIPKSFGGGFKHHDYVCEKNVNKMYRAYLNEKIITKNKEINSLNPKKQEKENWRNIFKLK